MNKTISAIVTAILITAGLQATAANATACTLSGSGTQASPWQVASASDLLQVGNAGCGAVTRSQYYSLTSDIALVSNHTPLLLASNDPYVVEFEGNNHTISGLNIFLGTNSVGLFSQTKNATIRNLNITGNGVQGRSWVGALVGYGSHTRISNVNVKLTGNVNGVTDLSMSPPNDLTSASLSDRQGGSHNIGGIAGNLAANSSITDSTFIITGVNSKVLGTESVGGVVGSLEDSTASRIAARASIQSQNSGGGVIGEFLVNSSTQLDQLFYSGSLIAGANAGGLVGWVHSASAVSVSINNSGVRGVISTYASTNPSAYIGNADSSVSSVLYQNDYSTATYNKSTNVSVATVGTQLGTASPTSTDSVYELSGGEVTGSSGITALTNAASLPSRWNAFESNLRLDFNTSSNWIIDTTSSSPYNNGRPMPKAIYVLGFFGDVGCSAGSYSSTGNTPCMLAMAGTFVQNPRSTSALSCLAGTYGPYSGLDACLPAPLGKFVSATGAIAAEDCPAGKYTSITGQSSCANAHAGRYVDLPGATTDTVCRVGTYQPNSGQMLCLLASVDHYVNTTGATAQTPCAAGLFAPNQGSTTCSAAVSSGGGTIQLPTAGGIVPKATISLKRVKNKLIATIISNWIVEVKKNNRLISRVLAEKKIAKVFNLSKGSNTMKFVLAGKVVKSGIYKVK